jgi:hypothetical protein
VIGLVLMEHRIFRLLLIALGLAMDFALPIWWNLAHAAAAGALLVSRVQERMVRITCEP